MTHIDLNRYRLEEPKDSDDVEEWIESINNSKSQASHQDLRYHFEINQLTHIIM